MSIQSVLETQTVEINGKNYEFRLHPGEEGVPIAFEVQNRIGSLVYSSQEALTSAFESLDEQTRESIYFDTDADGNKKQVSEEESKTRFQETVIPKLDPSKMMSFAEKYLKEMDPEAMFKLSKKLFKYVEVNGKPLNYNAQFAGNYGDIIPLMSEVIKRNGFLKLDPLELVNRD